MTHDPALSAAPMDAATAEGGSTGGEPSRRRLAPRDAGRLGRHGAAAWNYAQLLGGSVARLALSLVYFLALTRALSLVDFGLFAGAVAAGTVLSRLAAFGYGANLLQVAATRPRLLGHYAGVYFLWLLTSLPFCFAAAALVFAVAFDAPGGSTWDGFASYLCIVASEVVAWRALDTISTMNSGLGRFGYAAATFNLGTAGRALAALGFLALGKHGLDDWSHLYLLANLVTVALACLVLMPRVRPRLRRNTALLRWRAALALGGAGLAGSAQVEIDKLLVLAFGGAVTAGLYAICIRVIDLTAMPVRAFNVLMIRRVLKEPGLVTGLRSRILTEFGIALVSTAAYAVLLAIVHLAPGAFGHDIARASGLFGLLWAVPALRNLAEYQLEFLYAHGRMAATFRVALALMAAKTVAMALVFAWMGRDLAWVVPMNGVYLATYAISALITYRGLDGTASSKSRHAEHAA